MRAVYPTVMLVGLFLGLMVAVQFRLAREIERTVPVQRIQKLTAEVMAAQKERDQMQARVARLREEFDAATARTALKPLKEELTRYQIEAGLIPVSGPGIEITLSDSNAVLQAGQNPNLYVIHDEDVLRVLNELRAAGAEVLAINGERLVSTSEIRCVGPTILVNKATRIAAPFKITAIGDPDTMINALRMRGGVVDTLEQFYQIQVSIRTPPEVIIPSNRGKRELVYARPVREEKR